MLLANVTVAEHVLSHFANCTLLRRHQVPPPRQFEPLLKAASAAHFSIDISSSKVISLLSSYKLLQHAPKGRMNSSCNSWHESALIEAFRDACTVTCHSAGT